MVSLIDYYNITHYPLGLRRTCKLFNEMGQLLKQNHKIWTEINQIYWTRLLVGETVCDIDNAQQLLVSDIDIKSRYIFLFNPNAYFEEYTYQCIHFTSADKSTFDPSRECYKGHYVHICGYCGFEYELNDQTDPHVTDCPRGRNYWRDSYEKKIEVHMRELRDDAHRARRFFSAPDYLSTQGLWAIIDFQTQKYIPKSAYSLQVGPVLTYLLSPGTHGYSKDESTMLWADLDRIFDLDDNDSRNIFMRMKKLRENPGFPNVLAAVRFVEKIRDSIDKLFKDEEIEDNTVANNVILVEKKPKKRSKKVKVTKKSSKKQKKY